MISDHARGDNLFIVLLGDAAQNSMIGDGTTVSDGLVLIATLAFWKSRPTTWR